MIKKQPFYNLIKNRAFRWYELRYQPDLSQVYGILAGAVNQNEILFYAEYIPRVVTVQNTVEIKKETHRLRHIRKARLGQFLRRSPHLSSVRAQTYTLVWRDGIVGR
jgi:hypothetical protein